VQVEPIKPTLKAPGTKRLKLKYDKLFSSFAFYFNLRRYSMAIDGVEATSAGQLQYFFFTQPSPPPPRWGHARCTCEPSCVELNGIV